MLVIFTPDIAGKLTLLMAWSFEAAFGWDTLNSGEAA